MYIQQEMYFNSILLVRTLYSTVSPGHDSNSLNVSNIGAKSSEDISMGEDLWKGVPACSKEPTEL